MSRTHPYERPWYVVVGELMGAGASFTQAIDCYVVHVEGVHPGVWGRMRGTDGSAVNNSIRKARNALRDDDVDDYLDADDPDDETVQEAAEETVQTLLDAAHGAEGPAATDGGNDGPS